LVLSLQSADADVVGPACAALDEKLALAAELGHFVQDLDPAGSVFALPDGAVAELVVVAVHW
jgi:hypothetical protein